MSRTRSRGKAPGTEYWKSRLHTHGETPGHHTKRLTHRKERRARKRLVRLALDSGVEA